MTRCVSLVAAACLGLIACGPRESDATDSGEHDPRVRIVPSRPPADAHPQPPRPDRQPPRTPDQRPANPRVNLPPDRHPPAPSQLAQADVYFGDGKVGTITVERLEHELTTYPFEPAGSASKSRSSDAVGVSSPSP